MAIIPIMIDLGSNLLLHMIFHFFCNGNDLQNSGTAIFLSVHSIGHAGGYFVNPENIW
jgi:hypothetical protein